MPTDKDRPDMIRAPVEIAQKRFQEEQDALRGFLNMDDPPNPIHEMMKQMGIKPGRQ